MMQVVHSRFNALLSACVLSLIATAGWSQSLTWIVMLACESQSESYAHDVSADGPVVVGEHRIPGFYSGFRWQNGYMQEYYNNSLVYGVSADGSVVVGYAFNAATGQSRAFRRQNGVTQDLGTLPGYNASYAHDVSADGSVVVGYAFNTATGQNRAFRWQNGVMQDLGTLPGYHSSYAFGVSANGDVVVGVSQNAAGWRAFRWTASGGMQDLGTLPGGGYSWAYGVSANGDVVVGVSQNATGYQRAFRWTASGGMQDLGTLGGTWSVAYGVSADGAVVVGWAGNAAGQPRAFRWTASGGMEDLNTTYASLLANGSVLQVARAISPDGRYIVGYGRNVATNRTEAFLLDTRPRCGAYAGDVNCDGIVDDADLLEVLFNFGNRYR